MYIYTHIYIYIYIYIYKYVKMHASMLVSIRGRIIIGEVNDITAIVLRQVC